MKVAKACTRCRLGKRRCTASHQQTGCDACRQRALSCSLALSARRYMPPTPKRLVPVPVPCVSRELDDDNDISLDNISLDNISLDDRCALVATYIRLLHDKPHTLFHPPTLMRQVRDGSLPDCVLWAVMAMAARLTTNPALRARAAAMADRATALLKHTIDVVALWNVQACMLVGNLCVAVGDYQAESLWYGVAIHMAKILRLPHAHAADPGDNHNDDHNDDDAIAAEVRLRVWWSLYMMDRWSSAGNGLQRQLENDPVHPLPMDELQFARLVPGGHPPGGSSAAASSSPKRPGIWGQMVRLASIFARIQDAHRLYADRTGDADMEATTHRLSDELAAFLDQLPQDVTLSDANMRLHADRGLGSAFVALHLGFHHYATLLFFPFLDHQLEHAVNTATHSHGVFASRCKHHAAAFSDLLAASHATPGCDAVHTIVGHMTVVSSAALLHTLLFCDDDDDGELLPPTRRRLETNFVALVRLRAFWPGVGQLMDRLFAFQRACMWSADPNTHKSDRWMLKFLLNHALPVSDRGSLAEDLEAAGSGHLHQRGQFAGEALSILRTGS